jgi:hypothetical protein
MVSSASKFPEASKSLDEFLQAAKQTLAVGI